jgi:RecA/RadA recombinase
MEEVMAKKRKKLVCFQNTRGGMVKKGDTMKAFVSVNSPFTFEELVHMIDMRVNSKYVADLDGITYVLIDSVRGSMESLRLEFKRESEKLPRQVRAMVQHVRQGKNGRSSCLVLAHLPLISTW